MENFWKSTKCRVILCILALLTGVMIYALSTGGYTISTVGLFKRIAAPFQYASNAISERVEYGLRLYRNAEIHYEQNKALREEIAELNRELADYEQTKEELEKLKGFVGIKEEHEDFTLSAPRDVLGYITNDPFHAFMINGGTRDGIDLYDPVVTDQGLVGIITEVGTDTATVTTLLSPDISVAAYCATTTDRGVVSGTVALSMDGLTRLQYLDQNTALRENKVILTTGENGMFPRGYVIGYVRSIQNDDSGMTAYAVLTPAADLTNLDQVVVVTDFEGKAVQNDALTRKEASDAQ